MGDGRAGIARVSNIRDLKTGINGSQSMRKGRLIKCEESKNDDDKRELNKAQANHSWASSFETERIIP
jgi:hypothetical protein